MGLTNITILVVDDEESMRYVLSMNLQRKGYRIITAESAENALVILDTEPPDLIICDVKLPAMSGIQFLKLASEKFPHIPVIMMTAFGSFEIVVEAVKSGAYDYCSKPIRTDELLFSVEKALEHIYLVRENERLRKEIENQFGFEKLVGRNPRMQEIYTIIQKVAPTSSTVLVTGESGTGKELIARAIHTRSLRAREAFVPLNCAAVPAELFESELFGHVRGAYTGAVAETEGLFQIANKGTLFLDEVGEIPLASQSKLLRVLQDNEIRKVGGKQTVKIDVRLIAATEKNLDLLVEQGTFSRGLLYRLKVVPIHLPPLRERIEDIPLLASYFLQRYNQKYNRCIPEFSPTQVSTLVRYPWPGNVRELENWVERAVLMAENECISLAELNPAIASHEKMQVLLPEDKVQLPETLEEVIRLTEIELIKRALRSEHDNRTRAARRLGITHRSLMYKMKEYNIS